MYFWQVISCNLFLNKNVKIAGKNCKIRKTFWCTVKVQWLTTSICWLSKGQSDYSALLAWTCTKLLWKCSNKPNIFLITHCKYFDCQKYRFYMCSISHCSLTVLLAVNECWSHCTLTVAPYQFLFLLLFDCPLGNL